jgi:hypothetical protein
LKVLAVVEEEILLKENPPQSSILIAPQASLKRSIVLCMVNATIQVPSLSVLIPWNNREELSATLFHNQLWMAQSCSEVLILNCGGDQPLLNRLLLATDLTPRIRCLHIPTNSFNKSLALNIGLHFSRAKVTFVLDSDVLVESDFIRDAIERIHQGSFVTVKEMHESNSLAPYCQNRLTEILRAGALSSITFRHSMEFTFRDGNSVRHDALLSLPSGTRSGTGLLLGSRDNLIHVGGYQSKLEHWGWEDDDIQFRLKCVLGLNHCEIGNAIHLTHGDEQRNLGGKTKKISDEENFYACCKHYAEEDFQGSYAKDIDTWGEKVMELVYPVS